MDLLQIISAVVLTVAFMALLWCIKNALLRSVSRRRDVEEDGYIIAGASDPAQLEFAVRSIMWQREKLASSAEILIVDDGFDEETARMAEIFSKTYDFISVIKRRTE